MLFSLRIKATTSLQSLHTKFAPKELMSKQDLNLGGEDNNHSSQPPGLHFIDKN